MSSTDPDVETAIADARSRRAPAATSAPRFQTFTEIETARAEVVARIARIPATEAVARPFPVVLQEFVLQFIGDAVLDDLDNALKSLSKASDSGLLMNSTLVRVMQSMDDETEIPDDILVRLYDDAAKTVGVSIEGDGKALIDAHVDEFELLIQEAVEKLLDMQCITDALDLQSDIAFHSGADAGSILRPDVIVHRLAHPFGATNPMTTWSAKASGAFGALDPAREPREAQWDRLFDDLPISHSRFMHRRAIEEFRDLSIAELDLIDAWREKEPGLLYFTPDALKAHAQRLETSSAVDADVTAKRPLALSD